MRRKVLFPANKITCERIGIAGFARSEEMKIH